MRLAAGRSGHLKKGRPIKDDIDPNAAHLTEDQQRILMRRKANRLAMQRINDRRRLMKGDILYEVSELQKANGCQLFVLKSEAAGIDLLYRLHRKLELVYINTIQTQQDLLAQLLLLRQKVAATYV